MTARGPGMKRALGTVLLCGVIGSGSVRAEDDPRLDQVWSFLEALPHLTARFLQQDPDGTLRKGWMAVAPPGKARIEYEPPDSTVLVADGTWLVYHDPDAGQTAHLALDALPLRVLLDGRSPVPGDPLEILRIAESNDRLAVRIAMLDDDGVRVPGWIELVFQRDPFDLVGWTLMDVQQRSTVVVLEDLMAAEFPEGDLFRLSHDMIDRGDIWRGPWKNRRARPGNPRAVR